MSWRRSQLPCCAHHPPSKGAAMRTVTGLAAIPMAAALGLASLGVLLPAQATGTGADRFAHPASAQRTVDLRQQAIRSLDSHPGLARAASGQTFRAGQALVDRNGSTHVRVDRFYRGLKVVGGDMVVHNDARGRLRSVSQTLRAPLSLSVRPGISAARAVTRALAVAPARSHQAGRSHLVVDALAGAPRLAWAAHTVG